MGITINVRKMYTALSLAKVGDRRIAFNKKAPKNPVAPNSFTEALKSTYL